MRYWFWAVAWPCWWSTFAREVKVSFLELYNETVRDLLTEGGPMCKVLGCHSPTSDISVASAPLAAVKDHMFTV